MENNNDYVIYTMPMAKYLQSKGFMWKRVAPNKCDSKRAVFYFENTPSLVNAIKDYKEIKRNGKK